MLTALGRVLVDEITETTNSLVELGFADDQNYPYEVEQDRTTLVRYPSTVAFATYLKDVPYEDVYSTQLQARAFNVRMIDGALLQMLYEVDKGAAALVRSRLAFLPAPNLLSFQDNADLYEDEALYADVLDRRIVTVPLRFDFDARPGVTKPIEHPMAHLTLGQYGGCRIPASSPPTPYLFVRFILQSFYNSALGAVAASLPPQSHRFDECIHISERQLIHIGVPCNA